VDLVFLAVRPDVLSIDLPWLRRDGAPPVIAVVTYENPVLVEAVLALNAYGVIASPVKSFGLLTAMAVAMNQAQRAREREKILARAEQRLASQRKIAKAKAILMQSRGISEDDAYKLIRSRAIGRRVTTEDIADAVIQANEILGMKGPRRPLEFPPPVAGSNSPGGGQDGVNCYRDLGLRASFSAASLSR